MLTRIVWRIRAFDVFTQSHLSLDEAAISQTNNRESFYIQLNYADLNCISILE